jgi:hypothetical protein
MSLENLESVDAIGIDINDGSVVLTIFDAWGWEDEREHIGALQNKINSYLEFVESGQIYQEYPGANSRILRIDLVSKYPMPDIGPAFLKHVSAVVGQLGMTITHRVTPMPE